MSKRVFITGIGGQDGSLLAERLLETGDHEVHGFARRSSVDNLGRISHLLDRVEIHRGDLADPLSIRDAIVKSRPHAIYHLGDQDVVSWSRDSPAYSVSVTYGSVVAILNVAASMAAGRFLDPDRLRVLIPCSATVFGPYLRHPSDEDSALAPDSPYAVAKAAALLYARTVRRRERLQVVVPILYGHVSERQKAEYLLHRLAFEAVEIAAGERKELHVYNPNYRVDIGSAREFVDGMIAAMNREDGGDDYVLSTGACYTVGHLARVAVREATGEEPNCVTTSITDQAMDDSMMSGRCDRAADAFGWNPRDDAVEMVRRLVAHYGSLKGDAL